MLGIEKRRFLLHSLAIFALIFFHSLGFAQKSCTPADLEAGIDDWMAGKARPAELENLDSTSSSSARRQMIQNMANSGERHMIEGNFDSARGLYSAAAEGRIKLMTEAYSAGGPRDPEDLIEVAELAARANRRDLLDIISNPAADESFTFAMKANNTSVIDPKKVATAVNDFQRRLPNLPNSSVPAAQRIGPIEARLRSLQALDALAVRGSNTFGSGNKPWIDILTFTQRELPNAVRALNAAAKELIEAEAK